MIDTSKLSPLLLLRIAAAGIGAGMVMSFFGMMDVDYAGAQFYAPDPQADDRRLTECGELCIDTFFAPSRYSQLSMLVFLAQAGMLAAISSAKVDDEQVIDVDLSKLNKAVDQGFTRAGRAFPILRKVKEVWDTADVDWPLKALDIQGATHRAAKHLWFVAKTRSGKTFLLKHLILLYMEHVPGAELVICDMNYGKPDPITNEPETWMDAPLSFIRATPDSIYDTIRAEWEDLQQRAQLGRDMATAKQSGQTAEYQRLKKLQSLQKPSLLVIEELINFMNWVDLNKNNKEVSVSLDEVVKWITDILVTGLGYGKCLILVSQTLAVGETRIKLSMRDQLSLILLGNLVDSDSELKEMGIDAKDLPEFKEQVRRAKGRKHRVAVASVAGVPNVRIVPNLDYLKDARLVDDQGDEAWWRAHATPENIKWIRDRIRNDRYSLLSSKNPNRGELASRFDIKIDASDTKYQRLRAFIDAEKARIADEDKRLASVA